MAWLTDSPTSKTAQMIQEMGQELVSAQIPISNLTSTSSRRSVMRINLVQSEAIQAQDKELQLQQARKTTS